MRPRLAFAAPLPAGARGERELVDLWLTDRIARWQLREALAGRLPVAHEWVDAEDVWLAAPALAGQVAAADWRIELEPDGLPTDASQRLEPAARQLLGSRTIERTRVKGGNERRYDLRPLVDSIGIEPGAATVISVRTRFDPERGAGRPEEVIAALGEEAGIALIPATMSRLRLLLTVDLDRSR